MFNLKKDFKLIFLKKLYIKFLTLNNKLLFDWFYILCGFSINKPRFLNNLLFYKNHMHIF